MANDMTPSLLVAPPSLLSPPFDESVIILAGHENDTYTGFILNRPIGITINNLLSPASDQDLFFTDRPVLFGGPSSKNSGFVLYEHKKKSPLAPGFSISRTLSISPSRRLLDDGARGDLPGRFDLLLGCSFWAKGQLTRELSRGEWLHIPFCPEIIFDVPPEDRWLHAYKHLGIKPYAFMQVPGGAQA
jgi:putative transcriptional regulator